MSKKLFTFYLTLPNVVEVTRYIVPVKLDIFGKSCKAYVVEVAQVIHGLVGQLPLQMQVTIVLGKTRFDCSCNGE